MHAPWADVAAATAPRLLRLAVLLTGSTWDGEDLLQSTFAKAQRHADRIVAMENPLAYLRRMMVNEHISQRRRRRPQTVPLDDVEPPTHVVDADREIDHEMWRLLATLPKQQRAVLVLRYYEDLPDGQIAGLVHCAPATVRSHAARALSTLRTRLDALENR